jgi:D-glycero-D-manno-heptose 1,7-bisphosphate phosphatase
MPEPIRWAFLDRDGTINVKPATGAYIDKPGQLELLPGAAEAIRLLNDAGVWVGVVTNQRGIATGQMTEADLQAVHARLREELASRGARVDAIYYCPHEQGACACRKPEPGLLLQAQREHAGLSFAAAAIVGDSDSDVQAGKRVGATAVLLADPRPMEHRADHADRADHVARTLLEAVGWLSATRGLGDVRPSASR